MAKKLVSEKDVTSYKWVKIIQSGLLIVFGLVLCIFSNSTDVQNALGYIAASIVLLYGVLTIGFGMIFAKGILSIENVTGAALISLAVLIYVNPQIVLEYLGVFAGTMLLVFGLIFTIEAVIAGISKNSGKFMLAIDIIAAVLFIGLGAATLYFNYSSSNDTLRMILIILIGVILIIAGCLLIFYYAANPKFKIDQKVIYSEDGTQKVTIVKSDVYPIKTKSKSKKLPKKDEKEKEESKNELTEVK